MQQFKKGCNSEEELRLETTATAQVEESGLPFPDQLPPEQDKPPLPQDAPSAPAPSEDAGGGEAALLEKIRGVLVEKSAAGLSAKVRDLIKAHGANSLGKIDPADYQALLADAEKLRSASKQSEPTETPISEDRAEDPIAGSGAEPNEPEKSGSAGNLLAAPPTIVSIQQIPITKDWQHYLECNRCDKILNVPKNYALILKNDKCLRSIRFNEFTGTLSVKGQLPWKQVTPGWSNLDSTCLKKYISDKYDGIWPTATLDEMLLAFAAQERAWHPVKEFLERVSWDGIERMDTLLVTYLGADDTRYVREATRKTLVAAVARIYEPGIKFDYALTVIGLQGIGKSMFFSRLGGAWFSDSLGLYDIRDKTGSEKLQGKWIVEIPELAGMGKVDIEMVKSFITRTVERYRPPCGKTTEEHPRTCILVATTNALYGFLRDTTGNRRFLPVQVLGKSKLHPWDLNPYVVSQIWAEAREAYKSGEDLTLSEADTATAEIMQREAMESDDREGFVREYLDTPLPTNWANMDLDSRLHYLALENKQGTVRRDRVCTLEIWCECFSNKRADIKRSDSIAIRQMLCKMGDWKEHPNKLKFPLYGVLQAFVRDTKKNP